MVEKVSKTKKTAQDNGARFLSRDEIRALKIKTRNGNAEAAVELLKHSVRCRHRRLAFLRYFQAVELGAAILGAELQYLKEISSSFSVDVLADIRASACRDIPGHLSGPCPKSSDVHSVSREVDLGAGQVAGRSTRA